jgi:uncharacterized protein (DUF2062 family)
MRFSQAMQRLKRDAFVAILCAIGLLEAAYFPRLGIHWLIAALGATAFLAGEWIRRHWEA